MTWTCSLGIFEQFLDHPCCCISSRRSLYLPLEGGLNGDQDGGYIPMPEGFVDRNVLLPMCSGSRGMRQLLRRPPSLLDRVTPFIRFAILSWPSSVLANIMSLNLFIVNCLMALLDLLDMST